MQGTAGRLRLAAAAGQVPGRVLLSQGPQGGAADCGGSEPLADHSLAIALVGALVVAPLNEASGT